ncbi:SET domain-containing protein [Phlegmacium glaucopus]|nr:SET domain-containing protein [Phlegmacium glaucopus]
MTSKKMTPTRTPTKRFSIASSDSQPRPSVHFDKETLVSHPETINSSLKLRLLSVASHPPSKSSPESHRDDHKSSRRRNSTVLSPTKLSFGLKIDPIQPTPEHDDLLRRRRRTIAFPLTTTSTPDTNLISPRKRRFSTISPPPLDSVHDSVTSTSPRKRRFSVAPSEDKTPHKLSSFSPRSRVLCTIPPSATKPPPKVCAEVNERIKSTFPYPDFDFIQHVQHRSYVIRSQHFEETECVSMLDTGVDSLLQRMFEKRPPQPDTSMNVEIRASPGKGLGMFSRKEISNGEAFFIEYPTVITPYVIGLSVGLPALYADIFGRLSDPVFGEVMDLSYESLISGETKGVHEAIMRINALAIKLPVPGGEFSEIDTHRAIFLRTSRCNHSCGPNARWEWDLKRFALVLIAVRDIKEGEEITIPYIAPNMSSTERQDVLSNFYGFHCLCSFCTLPKNTKRQSDLARSTIASTWSTGNFKKSPSTTSPPLPSFENWCLDPTFPDDIILNAHVRALQSIEREGLEILDISSGNGDHHPARDKGRHLDAIAMCYGALEDVDNFRVWIGRASEARSKPDQKLVFKKWLSNPTSFPVWGWRKAFCEKEGGGDDDDSDATLSACVSMGMFEHI